MRSFLVLLLFFSLCISIEGAKPSIRQKKIQECTVLSDTTKTVQQASLNTLSKPQKKGIGLILGGFFLTLFGAIIGVGLLLSFLFGFSIGSAFYFQDIYTTAGIMLVGLGIFGLGVFMITRGLDRWKLYRAYRKAKKRVRKAAK